LSLISPFDGTVLPKVIPQLVLDFWHMFILLYYLCEKRIWL